MAIPPWVMGGTLSVEGLRGLDPERRSETKSHPESDIGGVGFIVAGISCANFGEPSAVRCQTANGSFSKENARFQYTKPPESVIPETQNDREPLSEGNSRKGLT